jgi:hypothetical protein
VVLTWGLIPIWRFKRAWVPLLLIGRDYNAELLLGCAGRRSARGKAQNCGFGLATLALPHWPRRLSDEMWPMRQGRTLRSGLSCGWYAKPHAGEQKSHIELACFSGAKATSKAPHFTQSAISPVASHHALPNNAGARDHPQRPGLHIPVRRILV